MKKTAVVLITLFFLFPLFSKKQDPYLITAQTVGPLRLGMEISRVSEFFKPPQYLIVRNQEQLKIIRKSITQIIIPLSDTADGTRVIRRMTVLSYDYHTVDGIACGIKIQTVMRKFRPAIPLLLDPETKTEIIQPSSYQRKQTFLSIEVTTINHSPVGYDYKTVNNSRYLTTYRYNKNAVVESITIGLK